MSQSHTSIATLTGLLLLVGCTGADPPPDGPKPFDAGEAAPLDSPYVECEEEMAEQVLLVSVTIPDLLDAYPFRVPFCKAQRGNETLGAGGGAFSATGPDGGMNGSIGIESSTETSLTVRVDLLWSAGENRGELEEVLTIPIGNSGNKYLPEARTIVWQFAAPREEGVE